MGWAKLDDRFHENRKVEGLWRRQPVALALHVMALTYCAGHETDGYVYPEFVVSKVPGSATRKKLTGALVAAGMWNVEGDGWRIHDYLDFHPSRASLEEKRAKDSERKARGRANGAHAQSTRSPSGHNTESDWNPSGVRAVSNGPVPTRPVTDNNQAPIATPALYVADAVEIPGGRESA